MASFTKKNALEPLLSVDELVRKSSTKKRSTAAGSPGEKECRELVMMRTMTNFPLEMQRRAATRCSNNVAMQALDIAPSAFLREKLATPESELLLLRGPKSTPKRKAKLRMDASVVVMRNVSLPKLHDPPSTPLANAASESDNEVVNRETKSLSVCASAPVLLGGSNTSLQSSVTHAFANSSVTEAPGAAAGSAATALDHDELKRINIERKLKLYEDIIATSDSETGTSSNGIAKRYSQPYVPVWKSSSGATSSSSSSPARTPSKASPLKRQSTQTGLVSSSSNVGFAHNPFGPFYTAKQVIEFGNILTRFDEDFSGDIDQQEWVSMLQSFRPLFGQTDQEATEQLFRALDRDDSGRISLKEILPAMFNKATPEQLTKMKAFIRTHTEAGTKKKPSPLAKD